jgi:hypothetical protein
MIWIPLTLALLLLVYAILHLVGQESTEHPPHPPKPLKPHNSQGGEE